MKSLVELICKVGIFMIAAQAVIHFAPAQKYAKYIKLVVGIMILLQFLTPIHKITDGIGEDWDTQFSDMKAELELNLMEAEIEESNSVAESIIKNLEMEIKSKLNNEFANERYNIIKVDVDIKEADEWGIGYNSVDNDKNNSSYEKYELDKLRVVVRAYETDKSIEADKGYGNEEAAGSASSTEGISSTESTGSMDNYVQIDKISVGKIDIDEDSAETQEVDFMDSEKKQQTSERLRQKFCNVLGIEEENMEVIIYGELE